MVVPRGWTLDDLRDPELHLFRPPSRADQASRRSRRRAAAPPVDDAVQLALGDQVAPENDVAIADNAVVTASDIAPELAGESRVAAAETDVDDADRWTPSFDDADDLDGLLSARSPLLSRAFRGAGQPD